MIMVSICMITFNHELYIEQAINGVLIQKCNFKFELVIGEDNSTDNTLSIIENIQKKYPNTIKILKQEKNIGAIPNLFETLSHCDGKYIAFCEGDDFWLDPYKLQKQIDFLETHTDYSLCFHDALVFWEDKSHIPYYFCKKLTSNIFSINDILNNKWFIPSASMVFPKEFIFPLPKWFKLIYNGDFALQLILAHKGKIHYINRLMSAYHKNATGFSNTMKRKQIYKNKINLLELFNNSTDKQYNKLIRNAIRKTEFYSKLYIVKDLISRFNIGKKILLVCSSLYHK